MHASFLCFFFDKNAAGTERQRRVVTGNEGRCSIETCHASRCTPAFSTRLLQDSHWRGANRAQHEIHRSLIQNSGKNPLPSVASLSLGSRPNVRSYSPNDVSGILTSLRLGSPAGTFSLRSPFGPRFVCYSATLRSCSRFVACDGFVGAPLEARMRALARKRSFAWAQVRVSSDAPTAAAKKCRTTGKLFTIAQSNRA